VTSLGNYSVLCITFLFVSGNGPRVALIVPYIEPSFGHAMINDPRLDAPPRSGLARRSDVDAARGREIRIRRRSRLAAALREVREQRRRRAWLLRAREDVPVALEAAEELAHVARADRRHGEAQVLRAQRAGVCALNEPRGATACTA
jgi:hypothetical protein